MFTSYVSESEGLLEHSCPLHRISCEQEAAASAGSVGAITIATRNRDAAITFHFDQREKLESQDITPSASMESPSYPHIYAQQDGI
jgi:hypothetical protein